MPHNELSIEAANARLKIKRAGLKIALRKGSGRLYLRGILPPKPGSDRIKPYQQYISLGKFANAGGIEFAEAKALEYGAKLAQEQFSWDDILAAPEGETCKDAITRFRKHWANKQEGSVKVIEQRWKDQFWYPAFTKIPGHRPVTPELLEGVLHGGWPKNSAGRQKAAQKFNQLAHFLKFDVSFTSQRGNYNVGHVKRNIPSDEVIEESIDSIAGYGRKGSEWQWIAGMFAVYNLRDHEAFQCDVEWRTIRGKKVLVCLVWDETKTGAREVLPLPPAWVDRWQLDDVRRPEITSKWGDRTAKQFKRMKLPYRPYDLRHAWNLRASLLGMPDIAKAAMMGHSARTNEVYQRHLRTDQVADAWLKAVDTES
ncbi:MAG: hypothetical protein AAGG51_28890 [Cyanobacteria bacterium P01_G01_bin.54]